MKTESRDKKEKAQPRLTGLTCSIHTNDILVFLITMSFLTTFLQDFTHKQTQPIIP